PDVVQSLGEADRRRRLALAEGCRRDRRDDDVLPARILALQPLDALERHLGLRPAVRLELVLAQPQSGGDLGDRPGRHAPRDLEIRWEAAGGGGRRGGGRLGGRGGHRRLPTRRRPLCDPGTRPTWSFAARSRWVSRRALVTGPTPPGTGVMADATSRAESMSTSPTRRSPTTLIPTSTTTAPGLSM